MLSGNQNATQGVLKGETGTGKELVARVLHWSSCEGPFITVDCGTLMENPAASELLGHCKGAFTEAHVDKRGFLRITVINHQEGEAALQQGHEIHCKARGNELCQPTPCQ